MIDRKEALDCLLWSLAGTGCQSLAISAIRHLPAVEDTTSWTSIKEDGLPKEHQPVIVYVQHPRELGTGWSAVMEDCWLGEDEGWEVNADPEIHEVTHWRPMPEPPYNKEYV